MRFSIFAFFALALSACQTTQTVIVQTVTTQIAGNSSSQSHTVKVVRDPVQQPAPAATSPRPVTAKPTETLANSGKPNPKDLDAVSRYCDEQASKVVYLKFGCSSGDQKKTCGASKIAEATHLSEFKHCLETFGWKEY
jgi:hypothetical protein